MNNRNINTGDKLHIAYFGSPDFSAQTLIGLVQLASTLDISIPLVFTQPDRPAGRGLKTRATAVKLTAGDLGITALDVKVRSEEDRVCALLREHSIDLAIVFAFNEIITPAVLTSIRYGFWNIHPSILPRYRGPSPISYQLLMNETKGGVTLMRMSPTVDGGDIIDQTTFLISDTDSQNDLLNKCVPSSLHLLSTSLKQISSIKCIPQDISNVTYTRKLRREDGYIPLSNLVDLISDHPRMHSVPLIDDYLRRNPSVTTQPIDPRYLLFRLYRGLHPWPGIWTLVQINGSQKRLKITGVVLTQNRSTITRLQIEGRQEISLEAFVQAYPHIFA